MPDDGLGHSPSPRRPRSRESKAFFRSSVGLRTEIKDHYHDRDRYPLSPSEQSFYLPPWENSRAGGWEFLKYCIMPSGSFRRYDAPICLVARWWCSEVRKYELLIWLENMKKMGFLFLDHGTSVRNETPHETLDSLWLSKRFAIRSQWPDPCLWGADAAFQIPISLSLLSLWVQVSE